MGPSWASSAPDSARRLTSAAMPVTARAEATTSSARVTAGITASMIAATTAAVHRPARGPALTRRAAAPAPMIHAVLITSGWRADQGGSGEDWAAANSFRVYVSVAEKT